MRKITLNKFLRGLGRKIDKGSFLPEAIIELTYDCNFKCVHCYNTKDKDKKYMKMKEIFKIIDGLKRLKCGRINLTGGEIFLRTDLFEIIEYIVKRGIIVSLQTNGSLLNLNKIERLYNLGVREVSISLLSNRENFFDEFTNTEGFFDKVISNIRLLKKRGFRVTLKTCALSKNIDELKDIRKLSKNLGVGFSCVHSLTPKSDGSKTPLKWRIAVKDYLNIYKRLYRACRMAKKENPPRTLADLKKDKTNGQTFSRKSLFNCGAGRFFAAITPFGKIRCCLDLPFPDYDVLRGGVKEGWRKTHDFVRDSKPSINWKCKTCAFWNLCDWCPARGYLETGDIEGCPEYFRRIAILRAKESGLLNLEEYREAAKIN